MNERQQQENEERRRQEEDCAQTACPNWWMCGKRGCYENAKAMHADPKQHRAAWEKASDYHFDGRTLSIDSTGGRREVTTFKPGEKFK